MKSFFSGLATGLLLTIGGIALAIMLNAAVDGAVAAKKAVQTINNGCPK